MNFVVIIIIIITDRFYIESFSALAQTHCAHLVILSGVTVAFHSAFWNTHRSGVLTALFGCYMACATWNCCHLGASFANTIQPCTSLQCHFIRSHIRRVHVCNLAVTCHQHIRQNDRDVVRATAVTREWNGYRKKSRYRKLNMERKILPPLLPGLEPVTFRSRVRRSTCQYVRFLFCMIPVSLVCYLLMWGFSVLFMWQYWSE